MTSTSGELAFTYSQQGVPIFVGQDYELWSVLMRTLFLSQELWDFVEEGYEIHTPDEEATLTSAAKKQHKENKTKDARALSLMHQGVSRSILPRISGVKMSKEAWQVLKNQFGGHEKVISIKLQNLWRDFDNLIMKDNEVVQDFFSRASTIVNQIRGYGDNIEDRKIVEKVLRCLPAKFEHIVAAIEESKDLSKLSLDELMGSLEAHEKRMSRFSTQNLEQAFQGKINIQEQKNQNNGHKYNSNQQSTRGRGRGTYQNFRGQGRGRSGIPNQRYPSQNSSSSCFRICRRDNHDTKDCRYKCKRCRNANHSQMNCWYKNDGDRKEANFTERNEAKDDVDHVFYSCLNSQQQVKNIWYVDSGCSNHMCGNKDAFVNLDESYSSEVKLGDGKAHKINGKGEIAVRTRGNKPNIFKDVFYVPNLTQNLLSVGQLLEKGYRVEFNNDACSIVDK